MLKNFNDICAKFIVYLYIGPGGNNGKSRWCELLKHMLGSYAYKAAVSLLLGAKQDAASVANFNKKRFIYMEEPSIKQKLQSHTIKDLTGGSEVAARKLYSQDTATIICATFALNTNNIPEFTQADEAIDDRLITYEWKSKFVKKQEQVNESDNVYLADEYIGSKEFAKRYGSQLFNILCIYHKKFMDNNQEICLTSKQKMNNSEILRMSDGFKSWMEETIVFTDNKSDFLTLPEIEQKFRSSEFWLHSTTTVKSCGVESYVKKQIMNRPELKKWYRKEKVVSKGKKKYDGYLIRHKFTSNLMINECNSIIHDQENNYGDEEQYDVINQSNNWSSINNNQQNGDTEQYDVINQSNNWSYINQQNDDANQYHWIEKANESLGMELNLDLDDENCEHSGFDSNRNHNTSRKRRLRTKTESDDLSYCPRKKYKLH